MRTKNLFLGTIQDNISLGDGGLDLTESWFTIAAFIIFPLIAGIVYFILKKKND